MPNILNTFFQLLQVAVGNREKLTQCPLPFENLRINSAQGKLDSGQVCLSEKEWALLYAMCKRQSLVGIGFAGISRLPQDQRPPLRQLAQWIHDGEKIKEKNERISRECAEVGWSVLVADAGVPTGGQKGHGMALGTGSVDSSVECRGCVLRQVWHEGMAEMVSQARKEHEACDFCGCGT